MEEELESFFIYLCVCFLAHSQCVLVLRVSGHVA